MAERFSGWKVREEAGTAMGQREKGDHSAEPRGSKKASEIPRRRARSSAAAKWTSLVEGCERKRVGRAAGRRGEKGKS